MLPDRLLNPGPLTYESGALQIALRGPAFIGVGRRGKGGGSIPFATPHIFHPHFPSISM